MTLLFISFIAGLLTVLAPCILPILPIIIGGSIDGQNNHKRTLVIIASLSVSLIVFTLLLKVSTLFINVPASFWTYTSSIIILFFGLTLLFPAIWEKIPFLAKLSGNSNKLMSTGFQKKSFTGDIIIGAALGPVFSTCSPTYFLILATVLPVSFAKGLIYIFTYVIGLAIALFAISVLGDRLVSRLGGVSDSRGVFKRSIGALFIVVAIFIGTGMDKVLQQKILDTGFLDVTKIESKLLNMNKMPDDIKETDVLDGSLKSLKYPRYVEIADNAQYVNTDHPITIGEYVGKKVIIVDFMTYSCINCVRTFPYLNDWYSKYEKDGLLIIGIHTPEFAFEKNLDNVKDAFLKYNLKFPAVLDNDYKTWNAWQNNSWPHKFIIDIDGYVVYDHAGEGKYQETEELIVKLLNEKKARDNENAIEAKNTIQEKKTSYNYNQSREVYFGLWRNDEFIDRSQGNCTKQSCLFSGYNPSTVKNNQFALSGVWSGEEEYVELKDNTGKIAFNFNSEKVYLVADSKNKNSNLDVYVDGKKVKSNVKIEAPGMYEIVSASDNKNHILELQITGAGFQAFTFTFGK